MIIDLVVGTRPNFVKAAAILKAAKYYPGVVVNLVHTGQHLDVMSDPFFRELRLPEPAPFRSFRFLGSDPTPMVRLGSTMSMLAEVFKADKPDYVMVVGDSDPALAGAIAAAKTKFPLIHVEAGMRSGNRSMQEEINRIMVDSISDILYTNTPEAHDTLIYEGHDSDCVRFVGNVMIDTLYQFLPEALEIYPYASSMVRPYAVLTLHRAETVDDKQGLYKILDAVSEIAKEIPVIWPMHPRVKTSLELYTHCNRILGQPPYSYLKFISLIENADFVMTDSGGVQEETTALGIPCMTLRAETERPETIDHGSNLLVGVDPSSIIDVAHAIMDDPGIPFETPEFWDGHAADRIMADLIAGVPN